jgi:hypothetical protein
MIVLYKNDLFELNMPFLLFESLKKSRSHSSVTILQVTQSTYKKELTVEINECEDYSIVRNLEALKN